MFGLLVNVFIAVLSGFFLVMAVLLIISNFQKRKSFVIVPIFISFVFFLAYIRHNEFNYSRKATMENPVAIHNIFVGNNQLIVEHEHGILVSTEIEYFNNTNKIQVIQVSNLNKKNEILRSKYMLRLDLDKDRTRE